LVVNPNSKAFVPPRPGLNAKGSVPVLVMVTVWGMDAVFTARNGKVKEVGENAMADGWGNTAPLSPVTVYSEEVPVVASTKITWD
jgi:hypothetical protein